MNDTARTYKQISVNDLEFSKQLMHIGEFLCTPR